MSRLISSARITPRSFPGSSLRILEASGNGIVSTVAAACNNLNQLSVACWVRPCLATTLSGRLFYKGSSTATLAWFDLFYSYSAKKFAIQSGWSTQGAWTVQRHVSLNDWHFVVITYDGSSVANTPVAYIDGVAQSVTTGTAPVGTRAADTTSLYVAGAPFAATRYLPGLYRNFRLFNRILTPTEADLLYRVGTVPSGLVLEYLLNTGSGTAAVDSSGSANGNGVITGGSWSTDTPLIARSSASGRPAASGRILV